MINLIIDLTLFVYFFTASLGGNIQISFCTPPSEMLLSASVYLRQLFKFNYTEIYTAAGALIKFNFYFLYSNLFLALLLLLALLR